MFTALKFLCIAIRPGLEGGTTWIDSEMALIWCFVPLTDPKVWSYSPLLEIDQEWSSTQQRRTYLSFIICIIHWLSVIEIENLVPELETITQDTLNVFRLRFILTNRLIFVLAFRQLKCLLYYNVRSGNGHDFPTEQLILKAKVSPQFSETEIPQTPHTLSRAQKTVRSGSHSLPEVPRKHVSRHPPKRICLII